MPLYVGCKVEERVFRVVDGLPCSSQLLANLLRESARYSPLGFVGSIKGAITGDLPSGELSDVLGKNIVGNSFVGNSPSLCIGWQAHRCGTE